LNAFSRHRGNPGCPAVPSRRLADQKSLENLQEIEKAYTHYADLLKQADAALEQANAFVDNYVAAHPDNASKGPKLSEAVKDVRELLSKASIKVNELDGQIAEAKRDAEQRQLADDPYSSLPGSSGGGRGVYDLREAEIGPTSWSSVANRYDTPGSGTAHETFQ
jgi:hypothetical protein